MFFFFFFFFQAEDGIRDVAVTGVQTCALPIFRIPLNMFVAVTGVSGSGKSTLVHEILYSGLLKSKGAATDSVGRHRGIDGAELIDAVELVDQSPIGRTPRSNPVTYTGTFDLIRSLFAETQSAKIHGLTPGSFSFNVPGGRCEACEGSGVQTIEIDRKSTRLNSSHGYISY